MKRRKIDYQGIKSAREDMRIVYNLVEMSPYRVILGWWGSCRTCRHSRMKGRSNPRGPGFVLNYVSNERQKTDKKCLRSSFLDH